MGVWELCPVSRLLLPLLVFCAPANNDVTRPRFAVAAVNRPTATAERTPKWIARHAAMATALAVKEEGAKHEHTSNQSTLYKDYSSNYVCLHGGPTGLGFFPRGTITPKAGSSSLVHLAGNIWELIFPTYEQCFSGNQMHFRS